MADDIHEHIKVHFDDFREERNRWRTEFIDTIENTIDKKVNGKIDTLLKKNAEQDEKLNTIISDIQDVLSLFRGTSMFFRASVKMAGWIIKVGGAFGLIWAFIKFVVMKAL